MSSLDPDISAEGQRLAELYSAMTEGELRRLADESAKLSDTARETLRVELGRRGLDVTLDQPKSDIPEVEFQELVTIRQFRDLPEALLAKGSLDSAGIESFLGDDNMVRMDWFISNLLGGIKLRVRREDADAADEILKQPIPETLDIEGIGEYEQPRCPKCQSLDISFEELDKFISYGSAWLNVPIPSHVKGWRCHSCRHKWDEDDNEQSDEPELSEGE